MAADKITWEQFMICNNDARGVRYRFEDLCRQLFVYEFLPENKTFRYVHSNPNNAGLESEPIYDEVNHRWIGYQVKFFDNDVDYSQLQHSAEKIVEYYEEQVDHVYIFCNKAITATCPGYQRVISTLEAAHISTELITDTTILDIVRKYHNLGLYYFENHSIDQSWFRRHTKEILAKLGERYNDEFNVDTKAALKLSLFSHDVSAVAYLNGKKAYMLKSLDEMGWRYDSYDAYKETLRKTVDNIADITIENIEDALIWDSRVKEAVQSELDVFNAEIQKIEKEREKLLSSTQNNTEEIKGNVWEAISRLQDKIDIIQKLIDASNLLKITDKEVELINANILVIKGKAGVGKSHLLANETVKLLAENRKALVLIGGDYLSDNFILEQICSNLLVPYSFPEMLEILNVEGELGGYVVPIYIDAINETWNKNLWKNAIPILFDKVRELKHVRLVISFRSEYQKILIDEKELGRRDVCEMEHKGFARESFQATQAFLNHYGIPFTPLHMFNKSITNPLFLTLYCKTYQGDEVELPVLYERILGVANENIHKNMSTALKTAGYDACEDVVTPVILALADFIILTGKRYFSKDEIADLSIWKTNGISLRPFIQNLIRENILHDYMYDNEERLYFAYDQMNDYYCAKALLVHFTSKEELKDHIEKNVLGIKENSRIKYENQDMFIYSCALFAEKYGEECIDIIDKIEDEYDREDLFSVYLDSFQWRKAGNVSAEELLVMCNKYHAQPDKVWDMFIANSLKVNSNFNADALHKVLLSYSLNKRDYLWTRYINSLEMDTENRLIQLIRMYNEGNGLETADKKQLELLLTLFGWLLTASSRWLRDRASKAMIELLKVDFEFGEVLLKKFENVNDPYVIQRLYGIVWGACVKRENKDKNIFNSLALYVYDNIFKAEIIYPDILLRDFARLIVERFLYEYPEERATYARELIEPPYNSEPIPQIDDQGYLDEHYKGGMYHLIDSMKFEGMGLYGDFGRYVFQSALNYFDVDHKEIFNYAVYFIINELGYDNDLFGEYDSNLGRYNYNRHDTAKVERIGKKYQWIAMYNILSRIADHCVKRDRFCDDTGIQKYEGPWDPYVRDFDPSLNEHFMNDALMPVFNIVKEDEVIYRKESEELLCSEQEEDRWIEDYPAFFDVQKSELVTQDEQGKEWVVLSKCANTQKYKYSKDKLQIWNWIYGHFITEEQYRILSEYAGKKVNLLDEEITWIPETYALFCREYPWSPGSETFKMLANKTVEDIGEILCASVSFLWEEQFDASKKEPISWYAPCAEIIDDMKLQYGRCDGVFYDEDGEIAAFDTSLSGQNAGLVIRRDLFDAFMKKRGFRFVWFVNASKEIHAPDLSIQKYSDWTGLLCYENGQAVGEIYRIN